jgi:uncharacterized protein YkwD
MFAMRPNLMQRPDRHHATYASSLKVSVVPITAPPAFAHTKMGRMALWSVIALTLIWSALLWTARPAAAQDYELYVPMIGTDGSSFTGVGEEPCDLNEQEEAVAELMINDPDQNRSHPICNPILAQVARERAKDMAERGYFSHTNPDGDGPNILVREAGYPLPDWYSSNQNSNNVESIGGGYETAAAVWDGWLHSPAHRTHVLAEQPFYAEQEAFGVGYYTDPNSPLKSYWVFISAPLASEE